MKYIRLYEFLMCTVGAILFSLGINIIIVPLGLFNGGFVGIGQLIRSILEMFFGVAFNNFDFAGIVYFILNIPLLILSYLSLSRLFFFKTIYTVTLQTILLSLITVSSEPIISDKLTACILGGIVIGLGAGIILVAGSSGGGQDILGVYFSVKNPKMSVGKISIIINLIVFGGCAILFDINTVVYSLIYTVISSLTIDKIHIQNINTSLIIISRNKELGDIIVNNLERGVTIWEGSGGYTKHKYYIMLSIVSKYEIPTLSKMIMNEDPAAFVIVQEGNYVIGNYHKRLC